MTTKRNDPCPCGSGKKYKNCHIGVPLETDGNTVRVQTPTWKLFTVGAVVLVIVAVVLWLLDLSRIAQITVGMGLLALIMWAAFRRPPPSQGKTKGDAAGINFGR